MTLAVDGIVGRKHRAGWYNAAYAVTDDGGRQPTLPRAAGGRGQYWPAVQRRKQELRA
jgi:hypothetical protein